MDEIPLPRRVAGRLYATSFSVVGPDPAAAVASVAADTLVCLITDEEIDLRFPAYGRWLSNAGHVDVVRIPIPDWGVVADPDMLSAVAVVASLLRQGKVVVTHCGAGLGRTGMLCALVLAALGAPSAEALDRVRAGRPGSGPDSDAQREQLARLLATVVS